jgi:hypothetical protein
MALSSLIDCGGSSYQTFDSGMAGTFTEVTVNRRGEMVQKSIVYVGVLTDILKLNYGPLSSPMILFRGKWGDSKSEPKERATIRYDETRLLQANFASELSSSKKMDYVLASQVQQVFFYPNFSGARWRTVLLKEPRSIHVHADYEQAEYNFQVEFNWQHHIDLARAPRNSHALPGKRKRN